MKKFISVFLITCTILIILSPATYAYTLGKEYTYICKDSTKVQYYLDENDMPYIYENGKKIFLLIPLEKFKIIDSNIIDELNQECQIDTSYTNIAEPCYVAPPSSYFSLQQNSVNLASNRYVQFMTFEASNSITTSSMRKHQHHLGVHVQTANLQKLHSYYSKKVTIVLYFFVEEVGWYSSTYEGVNATDPLTGYYRCLNQSNVDYIKVTMQKYNNNVVWFDLNVWTSMA